MGSKVPYDLIKAQLEATVGLTYPVMEWESLTDVLDQQSGTFLALEEGFANEEIRSVGTPNSNWMQEEGELDIHIFALASDGYGNARTVGLEIQQALRMKDLSSEVRIFSVDPPNPGLIADGIWSSMIVGLTYRYLFTTPTFV